MNFMRARKEKHNPGHMGNRPVQMMFVCQTIQITKQNCRQHDTIVQIIKVLFSTGQDEDEDDSSLFEIVTLSKILRYLID